MRGNEEVRNHTWQALSTSIRDTELACKVAGRLATASAFSTAWEPYKKLRELRSHADSALQRN